MIAFISGNFYGNNRVKFSDYNTSNIDLKENVYTRKSIDSMVNFKIIR